MWLRIVHPHQCWILLMVCDLCINQHRALSLWWNGLFIVWRKEDSIDVWMNHDWIEMNRNRCPKALVWFSPYNNGDFLPISGGEHPMVKPVDPSSGGPCPSRAAGAEPVTFPWPGHGTTRVLCKIILIINHHQWSLMIINDHQWSWVIIDLPSPKYHHYPPHQEVPLRRLWEMPVAKAGIIFGPGVHREAMNQKQQEFYFNLRSGRQTCANFELDTVLF